MPNMPAATYGAAFGPSYPAPKPESGAFGAMMAASARAAPVLRKPKNAAAIKAAQQQAIRAAAARRPAAGITPLADPGLSAAFSTGISNAADQGVFDAPAPPVYKPPPAVIHRTSGSGRSTSDIVSGAGTPAPVPAMFVPPESVTAPPAVVQPPAVVANAAPSEVNVPGESFTSIGTPGSFGSYERRRTARGPSTGLSVTPEMIRRAASQRLG